jgi:hypothetical protein
MPSIAKIAERERVSARYVRRLMRLAFLAPKIVEMIAEREIDPFGARFDHLRTF